MKVSEDTEACSFRLNGYLVDVNVQLANSCELGRFLGVTRMCRLNMNGKACALLGPDKCLHENET